MKIKLFALKDLGWCLSDGTQIGNIDGLDGSTVKHIAWTGYPDTSSATVLFQQEVKPYVLVVYEGDIPGGEEVPQNQLVLKLVELFGWPEFETSLDENGLPVRYRIDEGPAGR